MTIGNRAIGAPINIWNDHSDSMSMRDAGWIQLYAETNQEALDLHIQAFRLAEELSCPVMVCMDGFILTHAYDRVDVPSQQDRSTPTCRRYEPRQMLDPADPVSIGAMVGPEAFTEVRYLRTTSSCARSALMPQLAAAFQKQFGRDSGGLIRTYRTEDAETIVVALGSVNGTVQEVVDEMRADGSRIGSVSICSFRPFPLDGAARGAAGTRSASSCWKNAWRSAWAASFPTACASRCRASRSTATPSSRAWAGARSPARR